MFLSFRATEELRLSCDFILEKKVSQLQTFDPHGKETGNSKVTSLKTLGLPCFFPTEVNMRHSPAVWSL